jgi:hypothetical protein
MAAYILALLLTLAGLSAKAQFVLAPQQFRFGQYYPSGGGSFAPSQVTGCELWLTWQAGGGLTGNAPFGWTNQVGSGVIYTNQSTGCKMTSSGMNFTGTTGDYFLNATGIQWSNSISSTWVVFSASTIPGGDSYYAIVANNNPQGEGLFIQTGQLDLPDYQCCDNYVSTVAANTLCSVIILPNGNTYINGTAETQVASIQDYSGQILRALGQDADGDDNFSGTIKHVGIFHGYTLTSTDIANLDSYANSH